MYIRLARREEQESLAEFGEEYAAYEANTPAFLPRLFPTRTSQKAA
jgi:protein-S-isoprenylcysteine O-methyltransferase Ste14